jgi:hypothetical protein
MWMEIGKTGSWKLEAMAGKGEMHPLIRSLCWFPAPEDVICSLGTRSQIRDCNSRRASERRGLVLGVSTVSQGMPVGLQVLQARKLQQAKARQEYECLTHLTEIVNSQ